MRELKSYFCFCQVASRCLAATNSPVAWFFSQRRVWNDWQDTLNSKQFWLFFWGKIFVNFPGARKAIENAEVITMLGQAGTGMQGRQAKHHFTHSVDSIKWTSPNLVNTLRYLKQVWYQVWRYRIKCKRTCQSKYWKMLSSSVKCKHSLVLRVWGPCRKLKDQLSFSNTCVCWLQISRLVVCTFW